jgi:Uma2 family endonuclease
MSEMLARLPVPRDQPYTEADLAALTPSLPSGDVRYELNDGDLVIMPPLGDEHAARQAGIIYHLYGAQLQGLGEVRGQVGILLHRNPDRVVGADAAFILAASLPARRSAGGYLETIPELVVEVRNWNHWAPEITAKNEKYFQAGVRVVWVLDTADRTVAAHNADGSVQLFRDTDALTCAFLPGVSIPVASLFAGG